MKYFEVWYFTNSTKICVIYEVEYEKETDKFIFGNIKGDGGVRLEKDTIGKATYVNRNNRLRVQLQATDREEAATLSNKVVKDYYTGFANKL